MPHDISDAVLSRISNFAVGLVIREEGKGSRVLGSGVLVSIEGRRGILTCGHVAEKYGKLSEIGLVRFVAGVGQQRRILQLGDSFTAILQSSDSFEEGKEVLDLAFTLLPPDLASSVEANGVFLNIEKNRRKMEALAPTKGKFVDVTLGLIAELSGAPFRQGGDIINPMQGVLHTCHVSAGPQNGLLTVRAMDYDLDKLPKDFGGMSGSGLWRVYFAEDEKEVTIVETMLCGIVSWQIDRRHLACQGWDRIDQGLIPAIREKFQL